MLLLEFDRQVLSLPAHVHHAQERRRAIIHVDVSGADVLALPHVQLHIVEAGGGVRRGVGVCRVNRYFAGLVLLFGIIVRRHQAQRSGVIEVARRSVRSGVPNEGNVAALLVVSVAHVDLQLIGSGLELLLFGLSWPCLFTLIFSPPISLFLTLHPLGHIRAPRCPGRRTTLLFWFCGVVIVVIIIIVAAAAIAWAGATTTATAAAAAAAHECFCFVFVLNFVCLCATKKNKKEKREKGEKTGTKLKKKHVTQPVQRQQ